MENGIIDMYFDTHRRDRRGTSTAWLVAEKEREEQHKKTEPAEHRATRYTSIISRRENKEWGQPRDVGHS